MEDIDEFAATLSTAINASMSSVYRRPGQFVRRIEPCKSINFYGYHNEYQPFLKISLNNPSFVLKCADLLVNGTVLGYPLQPFESHIPYILHFLADNNLYGCNWMEFKEYKPRPSAEFQTFAELEADIDCSSIVVRYQVGDIQIQSLSEFQREDIKVRSSLGAEPFTLSLKVPSDTNMEWEYAEQMMGDLESRMSQINSIPDKDKKALDLPTPTDLKETLQEEQSSQAQAPASQLRSKELDEPLLAAPEASFHSPTFEEEVSMSVEHFSARERNVATERAKRELSDMKSLLDDELVREIQCLLGGGDVLISEACAPSFRDVSQTTGVTVYEKPHYSDVNDVPLFPFSYGGREFHVKGLNASSLPNFRFSSAATYNRLQAFVNNSLAPSETRGTFMLASKPPSRREVDGWYRESMGSDSVNPSYLVPSMSGKIQELEEDMRYMFLEIFSSSRPNMTPFPPKDPLTAVFWQTRTESGIITTRDLKGVSSDYVTVENEMDLFKELQTTVRTRDPDLLAGYETNSFSWGWVGKRYTELTGELLNLGRLKTENTFMREPENFRHAGRYIIDLWNVFRKELNLQVYTLEYVVYHVLHITTPHFSYDQLTEWWLSKPNEVCEYIQNRVNLCIQLTEHLEIVTKFTAQARVIGIDFLSSIVRGSQFKVEAVLCRLCKKSNFLLVSPSRKQVAEQNALERIPLVMEPQSSLYTDPVCVLDFRSLYPSIIIAFNLCYSTCIGRVRLWKNKNKLGFVDDLRVPKGLTREDIYIAPNGIGFVKPRVRRSTLAIMLKEILESRFMLKNSMKFKKEDSRYQRNLNGQQLVLKFIANVTYGYVSASFSGRMPCAEIADSIVSTGRELLTRTIDMIEATSKWGIRPQVVYGDTDSLFVKLPGVSKEQAFQIGNEIATMITSSFPDPIELEMEKVYLPCFLLTKKRYVGFSYESPSSEAFFDAKGTETIRRDCTKIEAKLEKRALEILFSTADLSKVKQYLQNQWRAILNGQVNLRDYVFSQAVRLGHYRSDNKSTLPGAAVIALDKMAKDEGAEPQYRERVPFLIAAGPPGSTLSERTVSPQEAVTNPDIHIDSDYYIKKNIMPPLERMFNLIGVNVMSWYQEMPKPIRYSHAAASGIRSFASSGACRICLSQTDKYLCDACAANIPQTVYVLESRRHAQEKGLEKIRSLCDTCSPNSGFKNCVSMDCGVYFEREKSRAELNLLRGMQHKLDEYIEWF